VCNTHRRSESLIQWDQGHPLSFGSSDSCIGEQGRALSFKTPIHEIRVRSEPLINMLCEPLIRAHTVQKFGTGGKAHTSFSNPRKGERRQAARAMSFVADLDHWIWVTSFRESGF
jgi:hypothetical protein